MIKNAFYVALLSLISWGCYQLSYPSKTPPDLFYDGLFFKNVIKHIDQLSQGPRGVGDYFHDDAQRYIISELHKMNLKPVVHKSTTINPNYRNAAPIRNIIVKIPGSQPNGKDLLLLSHYDAAKAVSFGAGDDASGVAIILEAIAALQRNNRKPVNDIILLFTDAEELRLLGAHAFINEKITYHDIGLIINLEARGSNGPSMMWPETVGGNQAMIEAYEAANVPMPATTSLHYEIYRLLPNDTDMTPFRKLAGINGFNLAFIGDHFNYHTALDNLERLSLNTLVHQTIQFYALLNHFAVNDLTELDSEHSLVYFSLPQLGLFSYPTWVNWILLAFTTLLLLVTWVVAQKRQVHSFGQVLSGFLPLLTAGVVAFVWCWLLLWLLNLIFPEQQDIMQGFPYQGMTIMGALLVSAGIWAFTIYGRMQQFNQARPMAPLLIWVLVLWPLAYYLPGSGWLIWPVVLSTAVYALSIKWPKVAEHLSPVIAALSFILLGALLVNLPIALGVSILPTAAVLVVMIVALFLPMVSSIKRSFHGMIWLLLPLIWLVYQFNSVPAVSTEHPHPTSISYLYDTDQATGHFYNYDVVDTDWLANVFDSPSSEQAIQTFIKSYRQPVRNLVQVDQPVVLQPVDVTARSLLTRSPHHTIEVSIKANSNTDIIELYTNEPLRIHALTINGSTAQLAYPVTLKSGSRLMRYFFDGNKNLELKLEIDHGQGLDWQLQTHRFDLLTNEQFNIPQRPADQIAKPFIKTDNSVVVQSFSFGFDE